MKKTALLILFSILMIAPLTSAYGSYRTHPQMIDMYKQLCDDYPSHASYETIGKTFQGNDIWLFKIGNPSGGKIILDSSLHGWEDMGAELTYLWLQWLLESDDTKANQILNTNYWLIVPVVNYDCYDRGNMNRTLCPAGGVDLNRNFFHGWIYVEGCNGDWTTSHGASAGSEKETKVMRILMNRFKPDITEKTIFINTH